MTTTTDPVPGLAPLDETATAADIAAAAQAHEDAAAAARSRADGARSEAEEILKAARERADQLLAEAEEQAAALTGPAAAADTEAARLKGIAAKLATAASCMSGAEKEDAKLAALLAERKALKSQAADLAAQATTAREQLARLASRRRDLESRLAEAGADDDLAIDLSAKISALSTTEAQVTAAENRATAGVAAAEARITAISREWPQNAPLYPGAPPEVGSLRFRALCLCDDLWPQRPGASGRRADWYRLNNGLSFAPPQQEPQQPRRTHIIR
jgi:chromosome segregation ATPase